MIKDRQLFDPNFHANKLFGTHFDPPISEPDVGSGDQLASC